MMKKGNATILASIFVMALVAAGIGAGTMAWFSTTEQTTSTYTMNAATMSMSITTTPITFSNLVPGQSFGPIDISIRNTGTMDIGYLSGSMVLTGGSSALADKIEVTEWWEYIPGTGWTCNHDPAIQDYSKLVGDLKLPLTLLEVAQSYVPYADYKEPQATNPGGWYLDQWGNYVKHPDDWISGSGYDQTTAPAIRTFSSTGQDYIMRFKFKFSETAGNDLQGASVSFTITFLGFQNLAQRP